MFRHPAQQQLTAQARCRAQLEQALRSLGVSPGESDLDYWSQLISLAVGGPARLFHDMEHVLHLCEGCFEQGVSNPGDGIRVLAALFHDAVYVQIDGGLSHSVRQLLSPFLMPQQGQLYLRHGAALQRNPSSALVTQLFGYDHCEPQPASQHNELLSALLMMRCLGDWLDLRDLAQVVVAIEATVPFREQSFTAGMSPSEQLFVRLQQVNRDFKLALEQDEMLTAIHRAVEFANCDVDSFANPDPAVFLDQTWRLLPELNPALRDPKHYTVRDYRLALQRMELFLQTLNSENIYQQFRNSPATRTRQRWQRRAEHNLMVAKLYLRAKIVAIALLEALAPYYEGGGAMADWIQPQRGQVSWEASFGRWPLNHPLTTMAQEQVLRVADQGRSGPCFFDLRQSPLAAFLIRTLGFQRIHQLHDLAEALFEQRLSPEAFLGQCEAKVVQAITQRLQLSA